MKEGYLTKQPMHGHLLSRPRRRYFVASERWLEWFVDELSINQPKGRMRLDGSVRVDRDGNSLVLVSGTDRLVLSGDGVD